MSKKTPLIILGSARQKSDTESYVDFVFNETPHHLISLLKYNINVYNYNGKYPSSDNFNELVEVILKHDTIIFATPVYWYSMSGLMKNLFDRFTDLITIKKEVGKQLKNTNVFLLAVGSDPKLPNGFEVPFKMTSAYFNMNYMGCVYFSTDKTSPVKSQIAKKEAFITLLRNR